ncbi:MAG: MerR family DNA-binding transcriptional regulator, partial [Glutamicibacter ardleyensis]
MEYSIGEFATLMNVTVKALRHYEKIGLLKPVRVDQLTGYRKYTSAQFGTVMLIR